MAGIHFDVSKRPRQFSHVRGGAHALRRRSQEVLHARKRKDLPGPDRAFELLETGRAHSRPIGASLTMFHALAELVRQFSPPESVRGYCGCNRPPTTHAEFTLQAYSSLLHTMRTLALPPRPTNLTSPKDVACLLCRAVPTPTPRDHQPCRRRTDVCTSTGVSSPYVPLGRRRSSIPAIGDALQAHHHTFRPVAARPHNSGGCRLPNRRRADARLPTETVSQSSTSGGLGRLLRKSPVTCVISRAA